MTHLELVAEIGNVPMEVVNIYFKGLLSLTETKGILGEREAAVLEQYVREQKHRFAKHSQG